MSEREPFRRLVDEAHTPKEREATALLAALREPAPRSGDDHARTAQRIAERILDTPSREGRGVGRPEPLRRLVDDAGSPHERAAGAQLALLGEPPPRSSIDHARTARRIAERLEGKVSWWRTHRFGFFATSLAAALLLVWGLGRRGRIEPTLVRVEEGQSRALFGDDAVRLVGPGEASSTAGELNLALGRIEVAPHGEARAIRFSHGVARVPAHSAVSITVDGRRWQLACWSGTAYVRVDEIEIVIPAGRAYGSEGWHDAPPAREPAPPPSALLDPPRLDVAPKGDELPAAIPPPIAGEQTPAARDRTPPTKHRPTPQGAIEPAPPPARHPSAEEPNALVAEARSMREVLADLQGGRAAEALALLETHERHFPNGSMATEAARARVDALLQLHRRPAALAVLERSTLASVSAEMLVVRGELLAEAHRDQEACADFHQALTRVSGALGERALWGEASCRSRTGDDRGARESLGSYLARYPAGRFAAQARQMLER